MRECIVGIPSTDLTPNLYIPSSRYRFPLLNVLVYTSFFFLLLDRVESVKRGRRGGGGRERCLCSSRKYLSIHRIHRRVRRRMKWQEHLNALFPLGDGKPATQKYVTRERERQWRIHQRGEGNQVTSLVLRFDFVKIASANGRS